MASSTLRVCFVDCCNEGISQKVMSILRKKYDVIIDEKTPQYVC